MPRQNIGWRAEMVASAAPGALSQVVPTSTVEEREGERAREGGREREGGGACPWRSRIVTSCCNS